MIAAFTARDVLEELDYDAQEKAAFFPDFEHGYHYHVDGRLTVYGDRRRWAVVIEQLSVNPRSGHFAGTMTDLYFHGNCIVLPPQPGWGEYAVKSVEVLADGPSGKLVDEIETINAEARDVRIRGEVVPIRTDENYYWARAIDAYRPTHKQIDEWLENLPATLPEDVSDRARQQYESMREGAGKFELRTWHLVRGLVPEYREMLLASEAERREGVPVDLPMLLQLDDWDHPRLLEGELPSGSESFKQIARALAAGDAKEYRAEVEGNVHWKNWPNSGNL